MGLGGFLPDLERLDQFYTPPAHPAFKISSNPLIIVLAFAIILMSLVVISVIYSKFDSELKRMRGQGGSSLHPGPILLLLCLTASSELRPTYSRTNAMSSVIILLVY